jgi:hypothetical protein
MNLPHKLLVLSISAAAVLAAPATRAQETKLHADAEIDPLAYALNGYSLHVGIGYRAFRLDIGAFAMDVPHFIHGNTQFEYAAHGFGLKLQYFFSGKQSGIFAGIDTTTGHGLVQRRQSDLARRDRQFSVGANVGYRIPIVGGLYVTPWIGLGYEFLADDITLGERKFESSPIVPFAAIHIGYRAL